MERERLKKFIEENHKSHVVVMFERGHDYATEDILSNFKRMAEICKIWKVDVTKPEDCAFFLRLLKIDRERNLLTSGKDPKGERLEDTFQDDQNYLDLMRALIQEANGKL